MKSPGIGFLIVGLSLFALDLASSTRPSSEEVAKAALEREKRLLSLFAIVQFKNEQCTATSGSIGTCYSSTDCSSNGGTATGNCAAGFGVCCIFSTVACGGTISQNNTYIANSGYPSTVSGTNSCAYTINYCNDNICQLRLDFDNLVMTTASGAVTTNYLTVDGPTGQDPPAISGTNTGWHMYVETNAQSTATTITATTGSSSTSQSWNIRVQQIECDSLWKAPEGCTQFFTSTSGTVKSYGYPSELASQENSICIRKNEGMCSTTYLNKPGQTFSVATTIGAAETTSCTISAVHIPNGNTGTAFSGFVCDNVFAGTDGATTGATITQSNAPFFVSHTSDAATLSTAGFCLNYVQSGC